jgi:hypothetical protein
VNAPAVASLSLSVIAALCIQASSAARAQEDEAAIELRAAATHDAAVGAAGTNGSLRVTFAASEWASIFFKPPTASAWDWSRHGRLVIELSNPAQEAVEFGVWWFVDPDGALFVSLGVDVVSMGEATFITGRQNMFTGLPGARSSGTLLRLDQLRPFRADA